MTANVTVAATAAVGLRDVTVSGSGRRCADFSFLGTDTFTVTAGAGPGVATKLAITSINGGVSPTVGAAFSVVVQAQDAAAIRPMSPRRRASPESQRRDRDARWHAERVDRQRSELGHDLRGHVFEGRGGGSPRPRPARAACRRWRRARARPSASSPRPSRSSRCSSPVRRRSGHGLRQDRHPDRPDGRQPVHQSPSTRSMRTGTSSARPMRSRSTRADANATLPANAALVAGTRTFGVTLNTLGSVDGHRDGRDRRHEDREHQSRDHRQRGSVRQAPGARPR